MRVRLLEDRKKDEIPIQKKGYTAYVQRHERRNEINSDMKGKHTEREIAEVTSTGSVRSDVKRRGRPGEDH